jgi:hypothetical protein
MIGDMWQLVKDRQEADDDPTISAQVRQDAMGVMSAEQTRALETADKAWVRYREGSLGLQVQDSEGQRTTIEHEVALDKLQERLPPELAARVEETRETVDEILKHTEGMDPDKKMDILFTALVRGALDEGMDLQDLAATVIQKLAVLDHTMQESGGVLFKDVEEAGSYIAEVRSQLKPILDKLGPPREVAVHQVNASIATIAEAAEAARGLGPTISAADRAKLQEAMEGLREDYEKLKVAAEAIAAETAN